MEEIVFINVKWGKYIFLLFVYNLNGGNTSIISIYQKKKRGGGSLPRVFIYVHLLKAAKSVLCYLIPLPCIITVYMTGENIVFMINFLLAVEY